MTTKPRSGDRGSPLLRRAVRASGLPSYWSRRYAAMRSVSAAEAANEHVVMTLRTLPGFLRWGYQMALYLVPVAFSTVTGRLITRAPLSVLDTGMRRIAWIPGISVAVRVSTALSLYGALDGKLTREDSRL
jgi:hypothetical protein